MKKNYCITLQYDGTRYNGWQKQGNTQSTIQGKLEHILSKLCGIPVEVHGSGRTDAGVHAAGQTANFRIDTDLSPDGILQYLNDYLPRDIAAVSITEADPRFHSRLWATSKTYQYRILTGNIPCVFEYNYLYHHPAPLSVEHMQEAASCFLGTHDFRSFCDNKRMKKSTVRTIYQLDIVKKNQEITITITGSGFLYHMVRLMVGFLLQVGEGGRQPSEAPKILLAKDRSSAGPLAPAKGLTLLRVQY